MDYRYCESSLFALPAVVLSSHILANLTGDDRKALRNACKSARTVVNGEVKEVRITGCHIQDGGRTLTLAQVAADYPQLSYLSLSDTTQKRISGQVLSSFLVATNTSQKDGRPSGAGLRALDVKQCHFLVASDMQALVAACPELQELRASRWADGLHLQTLQPLGSSLVDLDLGDDSVDITSITDKTLAHLPVLPTLQSLSLKRCIGVTDAGIAHLATPRLPALTALDLTSTRVCGATGFAGLRLQSLVLRGCRAFGDTGLAAVCATQAGELQCLQLSGTAVLPCGRSLWHLAQVTGLLRLDLGPSWEVDGEGLAALSCCPLLAELRLGNINLRTSQQPNPNQAAAADVNVWGQGPAGGGGGQQHIPALHAAALRAADGGGGGDGDGSPAGTLPASLPSLTHLSLGGMFCQHGLGLLLPGLPRLKTLELAGLSTARDELLALLAAAGGPATLQELRLINGGPDLTVGGLMRLIAMPSLCRLKIVACPCATETTVRQLVDAVHCAGRHLHVRLYSKPSAVLAAAAAAASVQAAVVRCC